MADVAAEQVPLIQHYVDIATIHPPVKVWGTGENVVEKTVRFRLLAMALLRVED